MSLRNVTLQPIAQRMARMYDRVEPLVLPSLGTAIAGCVSLMAAIGLAIGARWPAIGADAGTTLSTAKAALSGDHQWIEMLAPPAQVAVYAPFMSVGKPEFATAVPALFGALVLLLVAVTAWRITGLPWAGAIAGLFLLCSPSYWLRASQLPAYQQMAFFGYLGLILSAIALRRPRHSSVFAIAGGVALALSSYSFNTGLMFLPAALLLALVSKGNWKPLLLSLSTAAVLLLPFAVWHIAVAGVRQAWKYPSNFKRANYLDDLRSFYDRPDYDLPGYAQALPDMLLGAAPIWLWLLAGAGLLAIGKVHGPRVSAVIAAPMVLVLSAFVVLNPHPAPRYAYALVPAVALVAAVGVALAAQSLPRRRAGRHVTTLAASAITLFAVFSAWTAMSAHLDNVSANRNWSRYAEIQAVASKVDDDRAVLTRAPYEQVLLPDNQVYTSHFFSEDEYLDYILWQDEERVRRLLAGRDIGWVIFRKDVHIYERDFNSWTLTASGYPPRHYICLPQSAGFTEVHSGPSFTLYRVSQDWLQSESVSGSCTVPPEER